MAKRRWLRWGLGIVAVIVLGFVGIVIWVGVSPLHLIDTAFDPHCEPQDEGCLAWASFRANHPYPYQSFAAARLKSGKMLLVVSEPPPDVSHQEAIEFLNELFADGAPKITPRQWFTGADGYLVDLTVEFDPHAQVDPDLSKTAEFRDRIALLGMAWYGTAYGVEVEPIQGQRQKRTAAIAPNLSVTAAELRTWLSDASMSWSGVEDESGDATTWAELASAGSAGTFISSDGSLVLLTFPKASLQHADAVLALKSAFRRYAVASDATVGAVWTGEQLAFVGRARTHQLSEIPPLRFETFAQLAAQHGDALYQSYERNNPMAGKLFKDHLADWAPIFLSPALKDTELGSLLDITDQMLKSWSEAGTIDYLYFDYPLRPNHFPFARALSDEVYRQNKNQTGVLFNWNTAGSAVVLDDGREKLLTVHSAGSLPITYGSETEAGGMTTGNLPTYEEAAYSYFSALGDPNLARVVQYTLMYQTLRAVAADAGAAATPETADAQPTPGARVLIAATQGILPDLEAGRLQPLDDPEVDKADTIKAIAEARAKLATLRADQPDLDLDRLAALLADPRGNNAQARRLNAKTPGLAAARARLTADVDAYNKVEEALKAEVTSYLANHTETETQDEFKARIDSLQQQSADLHQSEAEIKKKDQQIDAFRQDFQSAVMHSQDLRQVRDAFEQANARDLDGWIQTPSYVTSQSSQDFESVGGHNLDARAIRMVADRSVNDLELVDGPNGRQLVYNPDNADVADHAADLSRAIEHGDADIQKLRQIVAQQKAPRLRTAALEIPPGGKSWKAHIGTTPFESTVEFASQLRTIKTQTPCCRILAKDAADHLYLAETNLKPPPTVRITTFGDSASFGNYMRGHGGADDVIVLDQPPEHIAAMFAGLKAEASSPSRWGLFKAAAKRLGGGSGKPADEVLLTDLRGRSGTLSLHGENHSADAELLDSLMKTQTLGAQVESLSHDEASKIVGGLNWDPASSGAPSVVRVRFGSTTDVNVVAGFSSGEAAGNQQVLQSTVAEGIAHAGLNAKLPELLLTIKHDLQALPQDKLAKIVFQVRQQGVAGMQLTLAPTSVAHG